MSVIDPARTAAHPGVPALSGPTPFRLDELVALTRAVAADVRAGRHPYRIDPVNRWSRRIAADGYVDVWLITWTREQSTELHDHAGSLGALTVVAGTLTERHWVGGDGALRDQPHPEGGSVGFPVGHVHDVVNEGAAPAVSVHAYSPPLTAMSYYRIDGRGALHRTRSILTDHPEPGAVGAPPTPAALRYGDLL
ncbi:cysteine dioxygenase [Allonocardiopsis opalescens]|uniref:Cysteine dioxygenase type I n=1 Tax=Allonocardiopsis opalescens TaxID=1144618 RepID=A0A2T0Q8A9_9ACTN|nr:cysteine dioxygenase family protein [Allonocardiopsis opalescens]PRY00066.1 Cysteine dioxygenase type I [Allonocardiopsis opalescens]